MEITEQIRRTMHDLSLANTIEDLHQVMSNFFTRLGIDQFAFICADNDAVCHGTPLIVSNYSADWLDIYTQRQYHIVDPIVLKTKKSVLPFHWDEVLIEKSSCSQIEFLRIATYHSIKIDEGATVPVFVRGQHFASMNICQYADNHHTNRIDRHLAYLLTGVATTFYLRVTGLHSKPPCSGLTNREKECLLWTSRGKSQEEIGTILGLSPRTVRFHNENAMTKLNANNAVAAVVLATAFGYI
ncbi:MAG: LuxR family transcriptional regulator [Pseudoalteromonas distincta]